MTADTQRQRAYAVAMYARRFAMLAKRLEYRVGGEVRRDALDVETRYRRDPMGLLDLVQISCAGPLDELCTQAVDRGGADLPDVDADRVLGIFYALPPQRRALCLRDAEWAARVAAGPAAGLIEELAVELETTDLLTHGPGGWARQVVRDGLPEVA